jgi:hypothetical protein
MPDPEHKNARLSVFYSRNHSIVADSVSPKFSETVAPQRLTDRTWIFESGDSVAKKAKHTPGGL